MAFYTAEQLRGIGRDSTVIRLAEDNRKSLGDARVKVFLSHSHVEVELVEAAKRLLEQHGADIYVDTEDSEMPEATTPETALKLRDKIKAFSRFVMLASSRSLASRWVPWELGLADAFHGFDKVAILPFTEGSGWKGTEYVGVYATIQPAAGGCVGVFPAGSTNGSRLSNWLSG